MLPTKGYFQAIECPYYENACTRPYCHFMHRKRTQEPADEPLLLVKEPEVPAPIPTYKPTPKSELANIKSHIPISYVPDLAFRPESTRKINRTIPKFSFERPVPMPTYNPTPLSILSSANTTSKYSDDEESNETTKATIQEIKLNIASVEYNPADVSLSDDLSGDINFEDLSAEFDLIDDIIDDSDELGKTADDSDEPVKETKEVVEEVVTKDKSSSHEKKTSNESKRKKEPKELVKESKSSHKKDVKNEKKKDEKSKEVKERSKSSSSRHKSSKSSKESKSGSGKDVKDKKEEKSLKNESSSDEKSRHRHKSSSSSNKEKKMEHKSSSTSSSKKRDRHKEHSSKEKEKKSKERDKHRKENKKKVEVRVESDGESDAINNFDLNDFEDDDDEDDDTMLECYKIFNEYKAPEVQHPEPTSDIRKSIEDDTSSDFGKKRIAHGSASEIHKPSVSKPIMQPSPAMVMANRFKLAKASQGSNEQNNIANALKRSAPPSLIEHARQTKLRKLEEENTGGSKLSMFRQKLDSTRPKVEPPKPKPTTPKPESNLVDSILNGSKLKVGGGGGVRRIAPVQNVSSIQREKAKIDEINKRKAAELLKTPAQTTKNAKRLAHVPEISLSDIPDVLSAEKSKLPVNVRTRFLTMMADECIKLYLIKEEAYNRALNEEFACYEKCKVLATYRNSAMLAVNRIRKELQERDKLGLGALGPGETTTGNSNHLGGRTFYDNIKKYILTSEDLDTHGYPKQSSQKGRATIKHRKTSLYHLDENQRKCSRCNKIYMVDDDGFVLYEQECIYHPLKKRTLRGESMYLCCKSGDDTGCATSHTHVSEMSEDAELDGYQMTMDPTTDDDPRSHAVYALDCEMCYTIKGLELTRVTVVDSECKTVYESLVKPLNPIIDYNTNFSGITEDQMEKTSTNILQVQANILHLCNSQTILIGHSLESDMKALKIIHGTIIDTSVMFPHKMGLPHKKALRTLASEYLRKIIQNSVSGHDSAEDAVTCMELIKWKVKEELKVRGVK